MKEQNILYSFILNILTKSIVTILIFLAYLFLYYGPKFEDNIRKLLISKNIKINKKNNLNNNLSLSSTKDILIRYSIIILLLILSLLGFYIYINKNFTFNYISDNTFLIDVLCGGAFTLYLVHYSLENYTLNVNDIIVKKLEENKI